MIIRFSGRLLEWTTCAVAPRPIRGQLRDFALLGYSGAKLPNDGFELVHPFGDPPHAFEVLVEVVNFRHEAVLEPEKLQG